MLLFFLCTCRMPKNIRRYSKTYGHYTLYSTTFNSGCVHVRLWLLQKVSITGLFVQIEQSREKRKALNENKHEDKNKNSNIVTFGSSVPDRAAYFKTVQSVLLKSSHWERLLHGSALVVVWAALSLIELSWAELNWAEVNWAELTSTGWTSRHVFWRAWKSLLQLVECLSTRLWATTLDNQSSLWSVVRGTHRQ